MPTTYLPLGDQLLEVTYTYDPGRPASGPYAPEYPTLEVEDIIIIHAGRSESTPIFGLLEELGALPAFQKTLLAHLEKEGSLK